ncbi:MAG: transporter substrate-binding domain-containing protein [Ectothiorhodospiraceae bacterium]|nr:transporter substrate-binding domain-containing protein [Chromatiales bacterium]MCP5154236.1 transporter substrate-binding domain-containing protein [Ectothiorhodospiraceae bacterium]
MKSTKLSAIIGVLGLTLGLTATPASAADLELNAPGKISVSTEGTFPPFSMQTPSGELDGIEIRLWREISRRLGLTYEPVLLKWESTLVGLMAGQFDVMGTTMDVTEARQKQILYSDGWLESGGVLLVQKDSAIQSVEEVAGKTIGTLVASTYAEAAKKLGAAEIKSYKSEPEAYQDLVNGNVDGVITDQVAGAYAIKTANLPLRIAKGYASQVQKGWGFQKSRPNLARAVNEALAAMMADGTYEKILTDLIGISPAPAEPIRSNF